MKQTLAMFACLLTAAGLGGIARAGVVIDEQVTTMQGSTPAVTHNRRTDWCKGTRKRWSAIATCS